MEMDEREALEQQLAIAVEQGNICPKSENKEQGFSAWECLEKLKKLAPQSRVYADLQLICTEAFASHVATNLWKLDEYLDDLKTNSEMSPEQKKKYAVLALKSLVYGQKAFSIEPFLQSFHYHRTTSAQLSEKAFQDAVVFVNRTVAKFEALLLRQRAVVPHYEEYLLYIYDGILHSIKGFDYSVFSPNCDIINTMISELNMRVLKYS